MRIPTKKLLSPAAAKAISELDGAEFFGRQMVVKEARPPKY